MSDLIIKIAATTTTTTTATATKEVPKTGIVQLTILKGPCGA